jgi:small subunit ribosomal protein S8
MSLQDTLSDMLTILRNAVRAGHTDADVKRSNLTLAVLSVLKKERYLFDFKTVEDQKQGIVRVYLRPPEGMEKKKLRQIRGLKRISKPSLRRYSKHNRVPRVLSGLGLNIVSTSKGVMTGRDAYRAKVGGEILLSVW